MIEREPTFYECLEALGDSLRRLSQAYGVTVQEAVISFEVEVKQSSIDAPAWEMWREGQRYGPDGTHLGSVEDFKRG